MDAYECDSNVLVDEATAERIKAEREETIARLERSQKWRDFLEERAAEVVVDDCDDFVDDGPKKKRKVESDYEFDPADESSESGDDYAVDCEQLTICTLPVGQASANGGRCTKFVCANGCDFCPTIDVKEYEYGLHFQLIAGIRASVNSKERLGFIMDRVDDASAALSSFADGEGVEWSLTNDYDY